MINMPSFVVTSVASSGTSNSYCFVVGHDDGGVADDVHAGVGIGTEVDGEFDRLVVLALGQRHVVALGRRP